LFAEGEQVVERAGAGAAGGDGAAFEVGGGGRAESASRVDDAALGGLFDGLGLPVAILERGFDAPVDVGGDGAAKALADPVEVLHFIQQRLFEGVVWIQRLHN
jgi:hypothetical protein